MKFLKEQTYPLYEEFAYIDTKDLINLFSFKKDLMVLNSAKIMDDFGRYTYICFDAFANFVSKNNVHYWNNEKILGDPFAYIKQIINKYKIEKVPELPSLQGGVVGYFGYEANHYIEQLPHVVDNIQLPDIYLNFYNTTIAVDHVAKKAYIIATGFPEVITPKRIQKAQEDIQKVKQIISKKTNYQKKNSGKFLKSYIKSNFDENSYIKAVTDTKNYVLNGDIFEANITQQFKAELKNDIDELELYFKLMDTNPAPFSAFIKIQDNGFILSASPERFIKSIDNKVETCPIKGTRKRAKDIEEDNKLAAELLASEKDHAENIMIVDLMRNDLSKVCRPGTINVPILCELRSFETVHHLVSKVTGELKNNIDATDVIKATFPPGSVTGAPKIRSMEIISELEKQTRGPYCGCIGYISFTGDMDTSVTIRSYFINNKKIFFSAGGAIVLDSNPHEEYLESLTKAQALIEALTQ